MEVYKSKVSKKVENILNSTKPKIERKATFSLPLASVAEIDTSGKRFAVTEFCEPETALENVMELVGQDELLVAKYFDLGRMHQARVLANNSLMGVAVEGKTEKERKDAASKMRKLLKTFQDTVPAIREVMELETDAEAREMLFAKRKVFAPLKAYFEALISGEHSVTLDFTSELPGPGWFTGDEEDDPETEEDGTNGDS